MSAAAPDRLVTCVLTDGVGLIRLADPAHRNALSPALSNELARAVEQMLNEGAGALVLTAEPPVFCAGGSLDALLSRAVPLVASYAGFNALAACPVPTIAAVDAPALGAGVNLPLACDVILTSPAARFDPRWLDVGIHPGGGHLWRLAQRIGPQGAAALVLCGDVLDGAAAAAAGLAWRCVPYAELEAQQWSMDQPGFADRIRALQASLASRAAGTPPPATRLSRAASDPGAAPRAPWPPRSR